MEANLQGPCLRTSVIREDNDNDNVSGNANESHTNTNNTNNDDNTCNHNNLIEDSSNSDKSLDHIWTPGRVFGVFYRVVGVEFGVQKTTET